MTRIDILLFGTAVVLAQACCSPAPDRNAGPVDERIRAAVGPDSAYRPVFHFTPPRGWMNDPNGLVFHAKQWHLFYQHYPDSNVWGPMHWGHAISENLVDWRHQPIALYPDSLGLVFSGSAVVDSHNTSGFDVSREHPPLVAIYTSHDMVRQDAGADDFETQSLAYSLDSARTWTTYAQNPVLRNTDGIRDFRDPKVIWDRAHQQWLMALASKDRIRFYASPNLRTWRFLSGFGADAAMHEGVWECPDFFPMVAEGAVDTSWVLLTSINKGHPNGGTGTFYFVGDWDGTRFTPYRDDFRQNTRWLDYGRDNYAGVTWSDVPAADGRRVFMGWMSNWAYAQEVPTTTWRSAMTVPRELTLTSVADAGFRLHQYPVSELYSRFGKPIAFHGGERLRLRELAPSGAYELHFVASAKTAFELTLSNDVEESLRIGFEPNRTGTRYGAFYIDRRVAGRSDFNEKFSTGPDWAPRLVGEPMFELIVLVDRTSVELFGDFGTVAMTETFWPTEPYSTLESSSEGDFRAYQE